MHITDDVKGAIVVLAVRPHPFADEGGRGHFILIFQNMDAAKAEYLERQGVVVVHPPVPAGPRLARHASLALFGDYVSLYLAARNGVDPTPIVSLDEFKQRLSEWSARRG